MVCHRSLKQCEYRPKAGVIHGFWTIIALAFGRLLHLVKRFYNRYRVFYSYWMLVFVSRIL